MNHIELFAGCGGLSLGLKSLGYELVLANELSPMASETFAYNFFNEDLSSSGALDKSKVKWLQSNYPANERQKRLREDPRSFPREGKGYTEVSKASDLKGALVVGSIIQLNEWLSHNKYATKQLANSFGNGELDLVSGGPPCQSFSMAGMREFTNSRNTLPWEFAKFVSLTKPKFALLENVTGILRPFNVNGEKVYAWFEVAKAFAEIGYVPLCLHINAKFSGVAQNRPRFVMLSLRKDIYKKISETFNETEKALFKSSDFFYQSISKGNIPSYGSLNFFDVKSNDDLFLFKSSFLKYLVEYSVNPHSVKDAIHDLRSSTAKIKKSTYLESIDSYLGSLLPKRSMSNHE
ncbi:MAG: DNA cytosine methyltransferase, partial [Oxalicibacterium faecigallinarum]|uniref:DNA cytosine methyltransferase n=1 Tax=Oxalicibacterium faecigallinarum TaxID=573741 RepID=UPI002806A8FF